MNTDNRKNVLTIALKSPTCKRPKGYHESEKPQTEFSRIRVLRNPYKFLTFAETSVAGGRDPREKETAGVHVNAVFSVWC